MPSQRFVNSAIAVGGVVQNILTGSKFEYLPVNAAIIVYSVCDIAGVDMTVTFGNVIEADQLELPVLAAGGPNVQDHRVAAGIAHAGDRLSISLRNGGIGAAEVRTFIEIRPL